MREYDHFRKHQHQVGHIDWNFNLTFGDDEALSSLTASLVDLTSAPNFYPPSPPHWLHATVLRLGILEEFSRDELRDVCLVLYDQLKDIDLPPVRVVGMRIWSGSLVADLDAASADPFYTNVRLALQTVVGRERTPRTPHARFTPHITFAYGRQRPSAGQLSHFHERMKLPINVNEYALELVKQTPHAGHYEWSVQQTLVKRRTTHVSTS